jgi:hypothetical protein
MVSPLVIKGGPWLKKRKGDPPLKKRSAIPEKRRGIP